MASLADVSDEEYVDDLIILDPRVHRCSIQDKKHGEVPQKIEAHIDLTFDEEESDERKASTALPVTFFDIPDNVKLLNACRPFDLNVVDCMQYKKHFNSEVKSKDFIAIDEDTDLGSVENPEGKNYKLQDRKSASTPPAEMSLLYKSPENKPKIRPVDISLYKRHIKNDSNRPSMQSNHKNEELKNRAIIKQKVNQVNVSMHAEKGKEILNNKEFEKQKVNQQNLKGIDFKKNLGLVGLKITHVTQLEAHATQAKDKKKQSRTKCVNVEEKSKSEVINISHSKAPDKESETNCSNKEKKLNLTKDDKQILESKNQSSFLIGRFSNASLEREISPTYNKNITIIGNYKTIEEKSQPMRTKVIDRLTFEQQDYLPQDKLLNLKQDSRTKSGFKPVKQDQQTIRNTPSSVDSVQGKKKKEPHKNLTKHWKETMRMFKKTKLKLQKPKRAHTTKDKVCKNTKALMTKYIDKGEKVNEECRENDSSVNPNFNNNCIVNKAVTQSNYTDCNMFVKEHGQHKSKYRDMPCLDDDCEMNTDNDKVNVDSNFCNMSQNTVNAMKASNNIQIKSDKSTKDSFNNDKQQHLKNAPENIQNSQNNTANIIVSSCYDQLNPGAKDMNISTPPNSAKVNDAVFVGNKQSNPGQNKPTTTDLRHVRIASKNSLALKRTHISNENAEQKNMKNMNNDRKNENLQHTLETMTNASKTAVPQYSENQDSCKWQIGLPESTCITVDNSTNSDKQDVSSSDVIENNVTNLTVGHTRTIISPYPNELSYLNQDNNNCRSQMSGTFAPTINTASGTKIDAISQRKDHEIQVTTSSHDYNSNTQSNISSLDKYVKMLNNGTDLNVDNIRSNVSPILNQPRQNKSNYYQPQGRPIETVTSNMGRYNVGPTLKNSQKIKRPVNQANQIPNLPQNVGGYFICKPIYGSQPQNVNFPANRLPYSDTFNTYNNQYNQFWNAFYRQPPVPPPHQGFSNQGISGQILQQFPPPMIGEGSTVIGQNDSGLIRTINISAMPKSIPGNKVTLKSNNANDHPSDYATVHSKLQMLEELTKELNNIPDVEVSVTHKADSYPNLNMSVSEKELNYLPNIVSRPTRPLSRKTEVGPTPAPTFQPYQNNTVDITGYSPPILSIPSYQEFEILAKMNMYPTTHSSKLENSDPVNYLGNETSPVKHSGFYKAPDNINAGNRKRKLPYMQSKQETIKDKPSDEYKKQMSLQEYKKKISLEEYKKRVHLNEKSDLGGVTENYGEKMENNIKCNKFSKENARRNSDLDLGYDSDSTVKL